ncbi:hypothetical protein REPUB_Repub16aG0015900 [Reevesia pubescens]
MRWNESLLKEFFTNDEVSLIMQIPIGANPQPDVLVWNETSTGQFSVKSAYHVARRHMGIAGDLTLNRDGLWKIIWGAPVLPRVTIFLWRVVWNIIPTARNLANRGIDINDVCCVCGTNGETWLHIFFFCDFSKRIWDDLCHWVRPYVQAASDDGTFWSQFFQIAHDKECMSTIAYILWLIWRNRNNSLHDQVCMTPLSLCRTLFTYLPATIPLANGVSAMTPDLEWQPPSRGSIKVNVDAAFMGQSKEAKIGIVARDSDCNILFSATIHLYNIASSYMGEVYAILEGLKMARQMHLDSVILESDCQVAVLEFRRSGRSLKEGSCLLDEAKLLAFSFTSCIVSFVRRSANSLAHNLAKTPVSSNRIIWPGGLPPSLYESI